MTPAHLKIIQLATSITPGIIPKMTGPELFSEWTHWDAKDQAEVFILALYLRSVSEKLIEQNWLLTASEVGHEDLFASYLVAAGERELAPFVFLGDVWKDWGALEFRKMNKGLKAFIEFMRAEIELFPNPAFQTFIRETALQMDRFSLFEELLIPIRDQMGRQRQERLEKLGPMPTWLQVRPTIHEAHLPPSLYRAYDVLDDVFQLRYELDLAMPTDPETTERIFENSGLGVQTSYATVLTLMRALKIPDGGHFIDLGSGYGRVGVLGGLICPTVYFTGYEYVEHRVEVAQASAERAGISARVKFFQQDLSDPHFEIPVAEVYYMYDPFCESTYRRVLRRLNHLARNHPVTVVTNADAGKWFQQLLEPDQWQDPIRGDEGTLLIFRSRRR